MASGDILIGTFPEVRFDTLIVGVLIFRVVIVMLGAVVSKRHDRMDRAEMATYIVLIAWASLLWGMALMKWAK